MPRYLELPLFFDSPEEFLRKIATTVNDLIDGEGNNVDSVTLTPNSTTTVVSLARFNADTVANLTPKTQSAAAALGALYVVATTGTLTLHHDSTADTDRTFGLLYIG